MTTFTYMFSQVTYEVFSLTDHTKCRSYGPDTDSFDKCNFHQLEQFFVGLGCSVPFLASSVSVCTNQSEIQTVRSMKIFILTNIL